MLVSSARVSLRMPMRVCALSPCARSRFTPPVLLSPCRACFFFCVLCGALAAVAAGALGPPAAASVAPAAPPACGTPCRPPSSPPPRRAPPRPTSRSLPAVRPPRVAPPAPLAHGQRGGPAAGRVAVGRSTKREPCCRVPPASADPCYRCSCATHRHALSVWVPLSATRGVSTAFAVPPAHFLPLCSPHTPSHELNDRFASLPLSHPFCHGECHLFCPQCGCGCGSPRPSPPSLISLDILRPASHPVKSAPNFRCRHSQAQLHPARRL
jgi:hypothetical protein